MTSPFHEEQGVKHKHGDIEFEWRSLLDTPCYGFSGPNACYSSTCNHNPSPSKTEKRLNKSKLSNSLKLSYKYHPKKSSNCERVPDYNTYKSIAINDKQSDAYNYSNNPYNDYDYNGSNDFIDSDSSEKQQLYDDLPLSEKTKDFNQQYETSDYQSGVETCSDSPYEENRESSSSLSNEIDACGKKYEFNPLSEPFHPTRPSIYTSSSSSDTFTASSPDCASVTSADDLDNSTTLFTEKSYVCILCPERFSTIDELEKHIEDKVQKPHSCFVCGVSFTHNYLLYRHVRNHRKLKTIKCRGCSKKFRNLHQLGKHFEFCRFKLYMFI